MNTFIRTYVLVAFVGLLFLGCSDKSITPIETTGANDNPASLKKDSGPGAWIIKHQETWASAWYDENSGLFLTLALKDNSEGCDGATDIYDIKDIYLPNADPDLRRIIDQIKGDVTAMVWRVSYCPCSGDLCAFIKDNQPFAIGTVKYRYIDNDYIAWAQDNNNSNAFSDKANGSLEGQDGKFYNLNFVNQCTWDPDGTKMNYHFKIQLTPTGK
jgi:hypothetical protein